MANKNSCHTADIDVKIVFTLIDFFIYRAILFALNIFFYLTLYINFDYILILEFCCCF